MPSHANLPTAYSPCWVPGDIMPYPFYVLYSHQLNKGELLSKILLYKLEHITKKGGKCVIMISFSQQGFMGSKAKWITTVCDNQDAHKRPSFRRRSLLPSIFSNYSASFEITNWIDYWITTIFCSHTMSTNRSPPKTTSMAPTGGLFGSQQHPDDNVGASYNNARNIPSKDTHFGQPTNQFRPPPPLPPPGYSYPPSQPPFLGAPQFYHHAPFNITPSSQPRSGATQGNPSYGPPWQGYDFPQGGYGGHQMFPPQQFTGHGPSSPGAPRVPPAQPGNYPVIRPTSSVFTAPGQLPGAPGSPPISLPTKRFQPVAEPGRADVDGIANLPPWPEISYDEYDAEYESDDSLNLGGAEGKARISFKQTEFSLKQFAKRMGQPDCGTFHKCKKVWVAGCHEKRHRSIIRGQNCLK